MNVVIFGATGMVGEGVLIECIEDPRVSSVLVIGRKSCGIVHPKLREILRQDLFDYSDGLDDPGKLDACFFCLGTSAFRKTEAEYRKITFDLTVAAAEWCLGNNSAMTFCYVSGQGTDSSEQGRMMWARVKGETENHILHMFKSAFVFRPGYIHPMKGVRSRFQSYRMMHSLIGFIYPVFRRIFANQATSTEHIGKAMINVTLSGYTSPVLENRDINYAASNG